MFPMVHNKAHIPCSIRRQTSKVHALSMLPFACDLHAAVLHLGEDIEEAKAFHTSGILQPANLMPKAELG